MMAVPAEPVKPEIKAREKYGISERSYWVFETPDSPRRASHGAIYSD